MTRPNVFKGRESESIGPDRTFRSFFCMEMTGTTFIEAWNEPMRKHKRDRMSRVRTRSLSSMFCRPFHFLLHNRGFSLDTRDTFGSRAGVFSRWCVRVQVCGCKTPRIPFTQGLWGRAADKAKKEKEEESDCSLVHQSVQPLTHHSSAGCWRTLCGCSQRGHCAQLSQC